MGCEALLVRGRDSPYGPYGCAIRIHGSVDLATIDRANGSRTRTPPRCSVIMRVQNMMRNVTDPALVPELARAFDNPPQKNRSICSVKKEPP
jgi:hypothetical protein